MNMSRTKHHRDKGNHFDHQAGKSTSHDAKEYGGFGRDLFHRELRREGKKETREQLEQCQKPQ